MSLVYIFTCGPVLLKPLETLHNRFKIFDFFLLPYLKEQKKEAKGLGGMPGSSFTISGHHT